MNTQEHILTILMEECSEVIKECAKIQRFGAEDNAPCSDVTNFVKMQMEMQDLIGTYIMYCEEIEVSHLVLDSMGPYNDKQRKIRKWMEYSKEVGCLG